MLRKFNAGDMVIVDFPGVPLHDCYGVVLESIDYGTTSVDKHGHLFYPAGSDVTYRVHLSNPSEDHGPQAMLRGKWIKLLCEKTKKTT